MPLPFGPQTARINAEWVTAVKPLICSLCHRAVSRGAQALRVSHHAGSGHPWQSTRLCAECAPKAASKMGSAYPGPPPPG